MMQITCVRAINESYFEKKILKKQQKHKLIRDWLNWKQVVSQWQSLTVSKNDLFQ